MCKIIERIIIREPGTKLKSSEHLQNLKILLAEVLKCETNNIEFVYYDDGKINKPFNDGL